MWEPLRVPGQVAGSIVVSIMLWVGERGLEVKCAVDWLEASCLDRYPGQYMLRGEGGLSRRGRLAGLLESSAGIDCCEFEGQGSLDGPDVSQEEDKGCRGAFDCGQDGSTRIGFGGKDWDSEWPSRSSLSAFRLRGFKDATGRSWAGLSMKGLKKGNGRKEESCANHICSPHESGCKVVQVYMPKAVIWTTP